MLNVLKRTLHIRIEWTVNARETILVNYHTYSMQHDANVCFVVKFRRSFYEIIEWYVIKKNHFEIELILVFVWNLSFNGVKLVFLS